MASSLVGESTMACTFLSSESILFNKGRPKAPVFPVPVWAKATKSWADSKIVGIASS